MTERYILLLTLILCQFSYSQSAKLVMGSVLHDSLPIQGVDVINYSTKVSTITDQMGVFRLLVKQTDTLLFYSAKYDYEKLVLSQKDYKSNNIIIKLKEKTIELEEVTVQRAHSLEVAFDQSAIDQAHLEKIQKYPKNPNVYDGTIPNGMDFVRIGKDIVRIFKNIFKKR
jgi:hypothetical protein